MKIFNDYNLKNHNTFGINVSCKCFAEYESIEECVDFLNKLPEGEIILHVGGGSNLLFTRDFQGTILHSAVKSFEIIEETAEEATVRVGSGVIFDDFIAWALEKDLYGVENLSAIPGEVGASAVQNIGAYGVEAEQIIQAVEVYDCQAGKYEIFRHDDCRYAYRHSIFKEYPARYVVHHVQFRLKKTFVPQLQYRALQNEVVRQGFSAESITASDIRRVVTDIRNAKLPDYHVLGNGGSFFMNPIVDVAKFKSLQKEYPDIPFFETSDGVKIPAGWLIEKCGWKGRRVGNAGVYEKQALILVNYGEATGREISELSQAIQQSVLQTFGIAISSEVNIL